MLEFAQLRTCLCAHASVRRPDIKAQLVQACLCFAQSHRLSASFTALNRQIPACAESALDVLCLVVLYGLDDSAVGIKEGRNNYLAFSRIGVTAANAAKPAAWLKAFRL